MTASAGNRGVGERLSHTQVGLLLGRCAGVTCVARSTEVSEPVVDVPRLRALQDGAQTLRLMAGHTGRCVRRALGVCRPRHSHDRNRRYEWKPEPHDLMVRTFRAIFANRRAVVRYERRTRAPPREAHNHCEVLGLSRAWRASAFARRARSNLHASAMDLRRELVMRVLRGA